MQHSALSRMACLVHGRKLDPFGRMHIHASICTYLCIPSLRAVAGGTQPQEVLYVFGLTPDVAFDCSWHEYISAKATTVHKNYLHGLDNFSPAVISRD